MNTTGSAEPAQTSITALCGSCAAGEHNKPHSAVDLFCQCSCFVKAMRDATSSDENFDRCRQCGTLTMDRFGICTHCIEIYRVQGRWCEDHGPTFGDCSGCEKKLSDAVNRLRGQSAVERLIAGLDRDAEDAAGRVKGVLSLCGRDLTDSELARVRAQVRAELLSFLIKANGEIGTEWFDMIAARQIRN